MVSRRRILSRSRDDLNLEMSPGYPQQEEEEDVWYNRDKLYKDHIQEVLDKWTQIDDEIWAKVIVLEKNRRVAKAYARAPVLTINGSDEGFDGFSIYLDVPQHVKELFLLPHRQTSTYNLSSGHLIVSKTIWI
uniref:MH2 domain-containing protein n=2 Tax=Rhodnius prolixus TaxID=13249 RepID=R4G8H6_RHOPR